MSARRPQPPGLATVDDDPQPSRKRAAVSTSPTPKRPRVEGLRTPTSGRKRRTLFSISPRESPSVIAARKLLQKSLLQTPKRGHCSKWTNAEKAAFVQYLVLHHDGREQLWPAFAATNELWEKAATFVSVTAGTPLRKPSAMRGLCTKEFKKFATFQDAEEAYGVDYYGCPEVKHSTPIGKCTTPRRPVTPAEKTARSAIASLLELELPDLLQSLDSLYTQACRKNNLSVTNRQYISTSFRSMQILQDRKKSNVLGALAEVLAEQKMPMDRMPWGLLEYMVQFFNSSHINQIRDIPQDLLQWTESVCSQGQGSTVLLKLLRGPMWSGIDPKHRGKIDLKKALQELPTDGHYWIKLDGTDLKPAVMESVKGVWSGDVDLGDGKLVKLQKEYVDRIIQIKTIIDSSGVHTLLQTLKDDLLYLEEGLVQAGKAYRDKLDRTTGSQESLKEHAWNYVEHQELIRLVNVFTGELEDLLHTNSATVKAHLHHKEGELRQYLKSLFKKKRTAATHILVIMVANEQRTRKPYSIPVQYIPYVTLRDQFLRDLLVSIKATMTELGLKVEGVVTDGEFHTLRTRGNKRSLHLWQLIHDAKDSVRKTTHRTLQKMLTPAAVDVLTGHVTAQIPNAAVPQAVLQHIAVLLQEGNTFDDVVMILRDSLVPPGVVAHPFRENTQENQVDKLRSILATYHYRKTINDYLRDGVDFRLHLYNPEVDATTGEILHERSDHNHILKRIATSTREGKNPFLNMEAFDAALLDPESGLTHAALVGLRKQSVPEAERLLSYQMAKFMDANGYVEEAVYIRHIARWHEASDGRGLSQLERCKANYEMLNYILDEWMPWHRDNYDFSTMDINKPTTSIRGLTYQTLIELTANIESQEMRRCLNNQRGYPEHPRAGTTDDNECFFSLTRRQLGTTFTLKNFAAAFPKIVREFVRKLDNQLPFYYFVLNERYHVEEPSFDKSTVDKADHAYEKKKGERLHTVVRNSREDSSIIVGARPQMPARHRNSIRTVLFKPDVGLPPVPENLLPQD